MKSLSIVLAAFSMGAVPFQDNLENSPIKTIQVFPEFREISGKEAVSAIRSSYERGEYDELFKELDDSYRIALESDDLKEITSVRPGVFSQFQDWEGKLRKLQEEKKEKLLEAVKNEKASPFVDKVRSAAFKDASEPENQAIDRMAKFRSMQPGTGVGSDENLLIAIDVEYEYKILQLYQMGLSSSERREKQCALKMEYLDCLKHLSQQFQDASLKEDIALYAKQFDVRLAQGWDAADLNMLINGKEPPQNALEEKIAQILILHRDRVSELSQQLLAEHEKN
jgi:hypothetical protein